MTALATVDVLWRKKTEKTAKFRVETKFQTEVLFCSLAFLDPRVGHTMDVLSPFISILCHSD